MALRARLFLFVFCIISLPPQRACGQLVYETSNNTYTQRYSHLYDALFYNEYTTQDTGVKKNDSRDGTSQQLSISRIIDALNSVFMPYMGLPANENDSIAEGPIAAIIKDTVINEQLIQTVALPEGGNTTTAELDAIKDNISPILNKYAEMIEEDPDDIQNYALYKFINEWYGAHYKWGGTSIRGVDCSGFSQKLYGNVYSTNIMRTSRQQHRHSQHISSDDIEEGDLVFFRMHYIRISHVGVYLANGYFVHASRSHGVVISNLNDRYWQRRFAGCGRMEKHGKNFSETLSDIQEM